MMRHERSLLEFLVRNALAGVAHFFVFDNSQVCARLLLGQMTQSIMSTKNGKSMPTSHLGLMDKLHSARNIRRIWCFLSFKTPTTIETFLNSPHIHRRRHLGPRSLTRLAAWSRTGHGRTAHARSVYRSRSRHRRATPPAHDAGTTLDQRGEANNSHTKNRHRNQPPEIANDSHHATVFGSSTKKHFFQAHEICAPLVVLRLNVCLPSQHLAVFSQPLLNDEKNADSVQCVTEFGLLADWMFMADSDEILQFADPLDAPSTSTFTFSSSSSSRMNMSDTNGSERRHNVDACMPSNLAALSTDLDSLMRAIACMRATHAALLVPFLNAYDHRMICFF
jgi:hypothetical protein